MFVGWRIVQQLIRTGYTTPRKLRYLGEDNAWKEEEWTGSDLGSTRDVVIQEGSFTMQTPSQKATVASQYAQSQVLTPDQYKDVVRAQIQPLLAVQDDPHLLRVRRQITVWKRGPGKQLMAQAQQAALAPGLLRELLQEDNQAWLLLPDHSLLPLPTHSYKLPAESSPDCL